MLVCSLKKWFGLMIRDYHPDVIEKAKILLGKINIREPIRGDYRTNLDYLDAYKKWNDKLIEFCDGVEAGRLQVLD